MNARSIWLWSLLIAVWLATAENYHTQQPLESIISTMLVSIPLAGFNLLICGMILAVIVHGILRVSMKQVATTWSAAAIITVLVNISGSDATPPFMVMDLISMMLEAL